MLPDPSAQVELRCTRSLFFEMGVGRARYRSQTCGTLCLMRKRIGGAQTENQARRNSADHTQHSVCRAAPRRPLPGACKSRHPLQLSATLGTGPRRRDLHSIQGAHKTVSISGVLEVPTSKLCCMGELATHAHTYVQMFVKAMTAHLKKQSPSNKQADNMRQIGQMWRELPAEQRANYATAPAELSETDKDGDEGRAAAPQIRTLSAHNLFVRAMHPQVCILPAYVLLSNHLVDVGCTVRSDNKRHFCPF